MSNDYDYDCKYGHYDCARAKGGACSDEECAKRTDHEVAQILVRLTQEILDLEMRCKDRFVREALANARYSLTSVPSIKSGEFLPAP